MKKMFFLLTLFLGVTLSFAGSGSLDQTLAVDKSTEVLDLIFLGAKVVGAIVIIMGIVELLVEKDQGGQQGKKVTGAMKLGGGILLLLAATFISWLVGDPDSTGANDIIKGK